LGVIVWSVLVWRLKLLLKNYKRTFSVYQINT
jgi:hypothetical protein